MKRVCMVDWSSQPDLLFRCDGLWETPKWRQPPLPESVHQASGGRLYTFYDSLVTCEACKTAPPRSP